MNQVSPKPPGWYLGLRYMQGRGLVARVAEPVDSAHRGAQFLFGDRVLCAASDWRGLLVDWWNSLAVGGYLILWVPDCRYQVVEKNEARVTLADVENALDQHGGWQQHEADLIDGFIYVVWEKRLDARQLKTPWRKQPKHLLICRAGAHGDALMASSLLPWLSEQGWAISFLTKQPGYEILRNDPHVDEIILQHDAQVADEELPYYWGAWEKRFDRFLNLTHSVEGELLKQPSRPDYWWSAEQRQANCRRSYLKYTHELAGVPGPYRVAFYPAPEEKIWADRKAKEFGRFSLWCLRGSAVHKWWPYAPRAICQLLARSDLEIVLSGDEAALPLADEIRKAVKNYFGDDRRVHSLVGGHSIREIMTLAHYAAVVVGPETGVLNAVSMQVVPKVLMLSHSARENLSDDWVDVVALKPKAACYPCHRLHYGHEWCPQDAVTGAAACAASIEVGAVVDAVMKAAKAEASLPWWLRGEIRGSRFAKKYRHSRGCGNPSSAFSTSGNGGRWILAFASMTVLFF